MNGDRRQDIGLKMVYVILTAIITLLMSIFFNKTYNMAVEAYQGVNNANKDIAVLQSNFSEISRRLTQIDIKIDKILLK